MRHAMNEWILSLERSNFQVMIEISQSHASKDWIIDWNEDASLVLAIIVSLE